MTEEQQVADIHATWKNRPRYTLKPGVECITLMSDAQSKPLFLGPASMSLNAPELSRHYTYRFVTDQVFMEAESRLLRLRRRVICEGVTVEEHIEPVADALLRGEYQPLTTTG